MVAETAVETEQRTLVLTAFPAEADAILARTTLDESPVVVVDGRHYYLGTPRRQEGHRRYDGHRHGERRRTPPKRR